jgi:hypothetical protein
MEWFLQMCRAEVFITYHAVSQDAYGRSVAMAKVAEPHWLIHSVWMLHGHKTK